MEKILKGKKILITAGPTWVPIDKVRVITNVFSGKLGLIIAEIASKMGAKVTLLMGPTKLVVLSKNKKNFNIINFKYFDEFLTLVKKEVGSRKYNIMIHSAAVADYMPVLTSEGKIKSGRNNLIIRFKPTVKIVDLIKEIDPNIFLVKFELEVNLPKKELIDVAYKSMLRSRAALIVANDFRTINRGHRAFIVDDKKKIIVCDGKEDIAKKLLFLIAKKI